MILVKRCEALRLANATRPLLDYFVIMSLLRVALDRNAFEEMLDLVCLYAQAEKFGN